MAATYPSLEGMLYVRAAVYESSSQCALAGSSKRGPQTPQFASALWSPAPSVGSTAVGAWEERWCTLNAGTLHMYFDSAAASATPERPLTSISLSRFATVRRTGGHREGRGNDVHQFELVARASASSEDRDAQEASPLVPVASADTSTEQRKRHRMLPRSATSGSLSAAFQRCADTMTPAQARQGSETNRSPGSPFDPASSLQSPAEALHDEHERCASQTDGIKETRRGSGQWTKVSLGSKRLLRLLSGANDPSSSSMSSSSSTSSLADQRRSDRLRTSTSLRGSNSPSPECESIQSHASTRSGVTSAAPTSNVRLRAPDALAHSRWTDALCCSINQSSSPRRNSVSSSRPSSRHQRPPVPLFHSTDTSQSTSVRSSVLPASHSTSSRITRSDFSIGQMLRRRDVESGSEATEAQASALELSRRTSAGSMHRSSLSVPRDSHSSSCSSETSGASLLSAHRRPSTSTGTSIEVSRTSSSSAHRRSDSKISSPPPVLTALKLETINRLSSPKLQSFGLAKTPDSAHSHEAARPTSSQSSSSTLDAWNQAAKGEASNQKHSPTSESLGLPEVATSAQSRFHMLRKASASTMTGREFSGACQGLGLDLEQVGRSAQNNSCAASTRLAHKRQGTATSAAQANTSVSTDGRAIGRPWSKGQGGRENSKESLRAPNHPYGHGSILTASVSSESLASSSSSAAKLGFMRTPSLFNLSARFSGSNSTRPSWPIRRRFETKLPPSESGTPALERLDRSGDEFANKRLAVLRDSGTTDEAVKGSSSLPVISLASCTDAQSGGQQPPHAAGSSLPPGSQTMTQQSSSRTSASDVISPCLSEASTTGPTTPGSPMWSRHVFELAPSSPHTEKPTRRSPRMEIKALPNATPPVVERILPPDELIATIDRLRAFEVANAAADVEPHGITAPALRSSRPRTSPTLLKPASFGQSASPILSVLGSPSSREARLSPRSDLAVESQRSVDRPLAVQPLEGFQHSLPAPPRLTKRPSRVVIANELGPGAAETEMHSTGTRSLGHTTQLGTTVYAKDDMSPLKHSLHRISAEAERPFTAGTRIRGTSFSTLGVKGSPIPSPTASPVRGRNATSHAGTPSPARHRSSNLSSSTTTSLSSQWESSWTSRDAAAC